MAKQIVVKYTRRGKCNSAKCRVACCQQLNIKSGYLHNDQAPRPSEEEIDVVESTCSALDVLNVVNPCTIYRNRPTVCREFPASPWDLIYRKVKAVCTFWFEIEIEEIEITSSPEASPSPEIKLEANGG